MCIHHCCTLHASGPNISSDERTAISIHLAPKGSRYIARSACDQHSHVQSLKELAIVFEEPLTDTFDVVLPALYNK